MKYKHPMRDEQRKRYEMLEAATVALYDAVPAENKQHVMKAWRWAKDFMMRREGSGHCFYLHREKGGIVCSFAKPEWAGDHGGMAMPTGAEAIVRAVCEYVNGY